MKAQSRLVRTYLMDATLENLAASVVGPRGQHRVTQHQAGSLLGQSRDLQREILAGYSMEGHAGEGVASDLRQQIQIA